MRREQHKGELVAVCMAIGVHAGLWWLSPRAAPVVAPAVRRAIEFSLAEVRVEPAAAAPTTAAPASLPNARAPTRARPRAVNKPSPQAATATAAAVAPQLEATVPVDLTAETFVIGAARAYSAGAATASSGTKPTADPARAGDSRGADDASSRVALESDAWSCPWPVEADTERIDEQTVVLRVVVDASGRVESATLASDPGHGFGRAAISCALQTRFTPARDGLGRSVRAQSPPIRVRFTR